MSRPIKFRAWNKDYKLMEQWRRVRRWSFKSYDEDDIILMQYTGLKDCNGTEIYEGDILQYWFGDDNYDTGFIAYDVEYAGYLFCYSEDMGDWTDIPTPEMMEVVGNIHENPELLDN